MSPKVEAEIQSIVIQKIPQEFKIEDSFSISLNYAFEAELPVALSWQETKNLTHLFKMHLQKLCFWQIILDLFFLVQMQ